MIRGQTKIQKQNQIAYDKLVEFYEANNSLSCGQMQNKLEYNGFNVDRSTVWRWMQKVKNRNLN